MKKWSLIASIGSLILAIALTVFNGYLVSSVANAGLGNVVLIPLLILFFIFMTISLGSGFFTDVKLFLAEGKKNKIPAAIFFTCHVVLSILNIIWAVNVFQAL